ncbi:MAG: hypothetical protein L0H73_00760 [Nitrococcus sp.]|nr:hypothetical protein [Nitrococcus sp.]
MRRYCLFSCTVSQTDHVFDVRHRAGDVHDSNGANTLTIERLKAIRNALPGVKLEVHISSFPSV